MFFQDNSKQLKFFLYKQHHGDKKWSIKIKLNSNFKIFFQIFESHKDI